MPKVFAVVTAKVSRGAALTEVNVDTVFPSYEDAEERAEHLRRGFHDLKLRIIAYVEETHLIAQQEDWADRERGFCAKLAEEIA